MLLFQLIRHYDHPHSAKKPYQILDSKENHPTIPSDFFLQCRLIIY